MHAYTLHLPLDIPLDLVPLHRHDAVWRQGGRARDVPYTRVADFTLVLRVAPAGGAGDEAAPAGSRGGHAPASPTPQVGGAHARPAVRGRRPAAALLVLVLEEGLARGEPLGLLEDGALRQAREDDVAYPVLDEELVDELVKGSEGVAAWCQCTANRRAAACAASGRRPTQQQAKPESPRLSL